MSLDEHAYIPDMVTRSFRYLLGQGHIDSGASIETRRSPIS